MSSLLRWILSLAVAATFTGQAGSGHALGHEDHEHTAPSGASNDPAPPKFVEAFSAWKKNLAAMHKLQLEYQRAESQHEQLEAEFADLLETGRKQLEQLQKLAETAFADGSRNADVLTILIYSMETSFKQDRYADALRYGTLLKELGTDIKGVHSLIAASAYGVNNFKTAAEAAKLAADDGPVHPEVEEFFKSAARYPKMIDEINHVWENWKTEQEIRAAEEATDNLPRVKLETSQGTITIELFEDHAPNTVASFISLVKKGFYDGTVFHRVLPHFMAQGGDPNGTGTGGPGYTIPDETNREDYRRHFAGSISMAKTDRPDTGGSQFFLTFKPTPSLDGRHTAFGRIIDGMDVLPKIQRIDPEKPNPQIPDRIVRATVVRDRGHAYDFKRSGER